MQDRGCGGIRSIVAVVPENRPVAVIFAHHLAQYDGIGVGMVVGLDFTDPRGVVIGDSTGVFVGFEFTAVRQRPNAFFHHQTADGFRFNGRTITRILQAGVKRSGRNIIDPTNDGHSIVGIVNCTDHNGTGI